MYFRPRAFCSLSLGIPSLFTLSFVDFYRTCQERSATDVAHSSLGHRAPLTSPFLLKLWLPFLLVDVFQNLRLLLALLLVNLQRRQEHLFPADETPLSLRFSWCRRALLLRVTRCLWFPPNSRCSLGFLVIALFCFGLLHWFGFIGTLLLMNSERWFQEFLATGVAKDCSRSLGCSVRTTYRWGINTLAGLFAPGPQVLPGCCLHAVHCVPMLKLWGEGELR